MGRSKLNKAELKLFLEEKADLYNRKSFIAEDPISIPHRYTALQDREIAGFFAATIAWGNRKAIVKNAGRMMDLMDNHPYDFISNASKSELGTLTSFVHRTFNGNDFLALALALRKLYRRKDSLEHFFMSGESNFERISNFRDELVKGLSLERTLKHLANPSTGSASKRLNMFLRWMVRSDKRGVDFGCWKKLSPVDLLLPLDVHSGNIARQLGLLHRKQNDAKAVIEITECLKEFDPADPVKYDFALFGLGIYDQL